MDQKERMLAELPYIASDEVLSRERLECKRRIYELNHVHPDQYNRIPGLLKELFGKTGEAVFGLVTRCRKGQTIRCVHGI